VRKRGHPDLDAAQHAYMALSGEPIDQTVIQRLDGALTGGASIDEAAQTVFEFFARPIDWDAERRAFAEWLDKRCRGRIAATVVMGMIA